MKKKIEWHSGMIPVFAAFITFVFLIFISCISQKASASELSSARNYDTDESDGSEPEYLCSSSATAYLTSEDISACTPRLLCYMRNEIYARHGRQFHSQELTDYFNSKSWYSGTISPDSFSESVFNQQELANIQTLYARELELCPGGFVLDAAGYDINQVYTDWHAVYSDTSGESKTISDDQIQLMKQGQIVELGSKFWLDLDQNGENEYVEFSAEDETFNYFSGSDDNYLYCNSYAVTVNDKRMESSEEATRCAIYGVSPDGDTLLLIVYALGPSDDPVCFFYNYTGEDFFEAGAIWGALEVLSIEDGIINGRERTDIMDTSYYYKKWTLDEEGYLEEIYQDYYKMTSYAVGYWDENEYYATLKKQVKLYSEMNLKSESIILDPQNVTFPYTDDMDWVYVKGESGAGGWLWMEDMDSIDGLNSTQVKFEYFDGLLFCD